MDSDTYVTFNDNHPAGMAPDSALVGGDHECVIYGTTRLFIEASST